MKIFSVAQIRACDEQTIKTEGILSIDLMERAAQRCATWIKENLPTEHLFVVLCGSGNNGGDGLAIARMLHQRKVGVKAFLLQSSATLSVDCATNLARLQQIDPELVQVLQPGTFITGIPANIVVIDAILGTGVNRPVVGWIADFIQQVNELPNRKIAIDIPSGLQCDMTPDAVDTILKVQDTLSFQFYKRVYLHPESSVYTGNVHVVDIGLSENYIDKTQVQYYATDAEYIRTIYKKRPSFGHKGTFGKAYVVGGQYGKMGAMVLCSRAALRSGVGLVTAAVPEYGYTILQTAVPEVMCHTSGSERLESILYWDDADGLGIGPGMGTDTAAVTALIHVLEQCDKPMVLDADALNIIAAHPELLSKLTKGTILTPHPKEFARLFGSNTNSMVQVENARMQAMRYNICIVLKGRYTAVISPEGECRYNTTGNAGMATGGAGDVLTGIITGLLAQGYSPYAAAVLGVYLHGLAGDIAAETHSQEAMVATDIIENMGNAWKIINK